MKILLFTPYSTKVFSDRLPASVRVREKRTTWSENLVEHLSQFENVEIFVVTISRLVDRDYVFKDNRVVYYYLKHPVPKVEWLFFYLFDVLKLRGIARKIDPDIIHAQGTEDCYGLAAVFTKYPVLLSLHASTTELLNLYPNKLSCAYLKVRVFQVINRYVISRCAQIHTQTAYLKRYFRTILKNKTVSILDLPINDIFFSVVNEPETNTIVFVSSSFRLKGALTLIKVVYELCETIKDLEVIVIGPDSDKVAKNVKHLVAELNLEDKVRFLGELEPAEIAHQLSGAKVFVSPTRCDTYGMAVIEALCAGVPVVSSNIMGIPYVVDDGIDGFLLAPDDVGGFARKIAILLNNAPLRKKMSQNAREKAKKRWGTNVIAKEMLKIYRDVACKER